MTATLDVLAAQAAVATLVAHHDLTVARVTLHPSRPLLRGGDPDTPMRPTAEVWVGGDPVGFLRWCRALDAAQVMVDRGVPGATHLYTQAWGAHIDIDIDQPPGVEPADVDRFDVTVRGHLPRLDGHPRLPGITVTWPRLPGGRPGFRAPISTDDLATALAALGLTTEETTA